jgi:hypothetical protein
MDDDAKKIEISFKDTQMKQIMNALEAILKNAITHWFNTTNPSYENDVHRKKEE